MTDFIFSSPNAPYITAISESFLAKRLSANSFYNGNFLGRSSIKDSDKFYPKLV